MTMQAEPHDALILQFASSRPEELAGLLANSKLREIAELVTSLPVETAAKVVARLPSWQLSSLLGILQPEFICRMLVETATDDAVAIVSHLHESRYPDILSSSSGKDRSLLQHLFEFPSSSLANLVTTNFIRVGADKLCAAFCEQMSERADPQPRPIVVVDQHRKYLGILNIDRVYARRNATRTVGEIAIPLEALSALTDAATALTSRLWLHHTELPVVDERHRLLGVVGRASLLRVVGQSAPTGFTLERIISELAASYIDICSRLIATVLGKAP
jgi:Mg/Co/Ni transporter MgtE